MENRIDVSQLMADIRMRANAELRERAFDRGNTPEFSDAELFDLVERVLRGAVDDADRKVLPFIVFVKRRLLQPLTQWLYEYSMDNFRRQTQINRILFATVQALAIETARLRLELDAAHDSASKRGSGAA